MKPKAKDDSDDGLLEYLEDIIGTSKYKEPIEDATNRLETINEERTEKLNRARYVGKEKDNLEVASIEHSVMVILDWPLFLLQNKKREAENFLDSENDLARRKNELYQIYTYEAKVNVQTAEKAVVRIRWLFYMTSCIYID